MILIVNLNKRMLLMNKNNEEIFKLRYKWNFLCIEKICSLNEYATYIFFTEHIFCENIFEF